MNQEYNSQEQEVLYIAIKFLKSDRTKILEVWKPEELNKELESLQLIDSISLKELIKISRINEYSEEFKNLGIVEPQEPYFDGDEINFRIKERSDVKYSRDLRRLKIKDRLYIVNLNVKAKDGYFVVLAEDSIKDFAMKNKGYINSIIAIDTTGNFCYIDLDFVGYDIKFKELTVNRELNRFYREHYKSLIKDLRKNKRGR